MLLFYSQKIKIRKKYILDTHHKNHTNSELRETPKKIRNWKKLILVIQ